MLVILIDIERFVFFGSGFFLRLPKKITFAGKKMLKKSVWSGTGCHSLPPVRSRKRPPAVALPDVPATTESLSSPSQYSPPTQMLWEFVGLRLLILRRTDLPRFIITIFFTDPTSSRYGRAIGFFLLDMFLLFSTRRHRKMSSPFPGSCWWAESLPVSVQLFNNNYSNPYIFSTDAILHFGPNLLGNPSIIQ